MAILGRGASSIHHPAPWQSERFQFRRQTSGSAGRLQRIVRRARSVGAERAAQYVCKRALATSRRPYGPLFRRVLRGGHSSAEPLGADGIRKIVRKRVAAVIGVAGRFGGHSLRVGSARELAAAGASVAELQQAGGWRSPTTPEV